ncbi:translation initiation factor IF-2-like [Acinonyx jubatus]|uniref:Translation initiation factor IF-2-like n=1 Tax=Acinonyx jubatus TaxID=32536 RepID=A0ABM3PJA8_ACIJB|nr:translation initiation factor IF-2-like [Acinonyx jubatus]
MDTQTFWRGLGWGPLRTILGENQRPTVQNHTHSPREEDGFLSAGDGWAPPRKCGSHRPTTRRPSPASVRSRASESPRSAAALPAPGPPRAPPLPTAARTGAPAPGAGAGVGVGEHSPGEDKARRQPRLAPRGREREAAGARSPPGTKTRSSRSGFAGCSHWTDRAAARSLWGARK